jgi:uncharacterized protein (DUF433 family)
MLPVGARYEIRFTSELAGSCGWIPLSMTRWPGGRPTSCAAPTPRSRSCSGRPSPMRDGCQAMSAGSVGAAGLPAKRHHDRTSRVVRPAGPLRRSRRLTAWPINGYALRAGEVRHFAGDDGARPGDVHRGGGSPAASCPAVHPALLVGGRRPTWQELQACDPTRPVGTRVVTWAEFVEAGWLKEYRQRSVPMAELRTFIDRLRQDFGVPYPLAHRRPLVSGRQLVLEAQEAAGLRPEYWLVAWASGQLLLTPPSHSFVERIDWDADVAVGYRPDPNPESPVRISPDIRFGRPAIKGISTEAIWEQADEGEEVEDIAQVNGLTVAEVRWALAYENSQQAA